MSGFFTAFGKTLIRIFGDAKLRADLDAYEAWQVVQATKEGQDFVAKLSRAALLNFGGVLAGAPVPPETPGKWIMTPGGHYEFHPGESQ